MISFKLVLGVLFALLVAGIAVLGVVSYQNSEDSVETAERVRHTHEALERTDEISSLYKTIQLESNAFFISGDSAILQPYWSAREQILPRIEQLTALTQDSPNQKSRIDSLTAYVGEVISFTNGGLKSEHQFTMEEMARRVEIHFLYRQNIRKVIQGIKEEEGRLLIKREQAHKASIAAFNRTFFLLISFIALLLLATFFLIRYNFNKRIKAEKDQRKANELFTRLFYESPMGIVISNLNTGKIIDCNSSYIEMVKFSKTELIGKNIVELGILNSDAEREAIVSHVRDTGVSRDVEVRLRPKNSDQIWVSKSMQLIRINNENCLLSAVLDMTSHKEAEEKTKQALNSEIELNKLKSNFLTLASHEFRTPLTTILSSAFLLENYTSGDKEKAGKHVARIKGSVKLLTSILDEFLSVTKIEEGKIEPRKEGMNLKDMLENLCGDLRTFARPGQKIVYEHFGDEVINSDPILLGNIVNNLVSNAIKYSNDNDEIRVSTTVNAKVHLSVKDQGIGISKADQQHLFERFFRASNSGNIQGTGLGLHIMKHYVDLLHGSIEVQSEPGKGSEFKVTFDHA
jgi:PAS domain S-box-containing protein